MKLESRQEIVMVIIVAMPRQSRTVLSSVQLEIPLLFYGETPVTNTLKKTYYTYVILMLWIHNIIISKMI